jgi:hypothetical protein
MQIFDLSKVSESEAEAYNHSSHVKYHCFVLRHSGMLNSVCLNEWLRTYSFKQIKQRDKIFSRQKHLSAKRSVASIETNTIKDKPVFDSLLYCYFGFDLQTRNYKSHEKCYSSRVYQFVNKCKACL